MTLSSASVSKNSPCMYVLYHKCVFYNCHRYYRLARPLTGFEIKSPAISTFHDWLLPTLPTKSSSFPSLPYLSSFCALIMDASCASAQPIVIQDSGRWCWLVNLAANHLTDWSILKGAICASIYSFPKLVLIAGAHFCYMLHVIHDAIVINRNLRN
jgi:hypothetical protein